ncbi:MAG: hypothetical protein ACRELB_14710 [Polyangiaceae bacterium]
MRPSSLPLALALLGAAACSHPAPAGAPPVEAGADPVEAAVCAGRADCRVEARLALPPGPGGRERLSVVARMTAVPGGSDGRLGSIAENPWRGDGPPTPLPRVAGCTLEEAWLVGRDAAGATREQLLTSDCSTEPRDALVLAALPGGDLQITRASTEKLDVALEPTRVRRVARNGTWWDEDAFRGEWCDPQAPGACSPVLPDVRIDDDGSFARGGWQTTGLGACSLLVGGSASGASLRLLMSDRTLYVEITDDALVGRAPAADHLVVFSDYLESKGGSGWVDDLAFDGTWTGHDHARRHMATSEVSPTVRRFAIDGVFPLAPRSFSVTYEDAAGEKSARRRLRAPSSKGATLPVLTWGGASCAPRDGVLKVVPSTAKAADVALAP